MKELLSLTRQEMLVLPQLFRISALANGADDANAIGSRLDDWCRIFIRDTADAHNRNVKTVLTYFVD